MRSEVACIIDETHGKINNGWSLRRVRVQSEVLGDETNESPGENLALFTIPRARV